ncbi:alanyl-tRNA editing protein [Paenibacillus sp. P96]|uniref:Alanyl-tRNA editing protein n=1 Tax=Paenibacillus zeirhizosphaerae TaxID=2987519 RepID=A0ABT9FTC3_9BACL|nr:alanyl-tRNA editing protein [Paenibacillus sp. P96]MDP4097986.1 alanyl-tRNA editing protein [Paenibacillus sp. P96]
MTKKLYYNSAYITEWKTGITQELERDGRKLVVLEETAFYPAGGGQPCDTGTVNGIPVLDVFSEGDTIFHEVERMPEEMNAVCKLDWSRRWDHMQQHSGQHLLSAVILSSLGARTLSFHLGQEDCTIDIELPELNRAQMEAVEQEVNAEIYRNRDIRSYFVTEEQLKNITLVKQPKVTENIRIVEIEGIEYNACGGTHVARTGELGLVKLLKTDKQKGNVRIYFKCGARALQDYNESLRILEVVAGKFNTGRHDIVDRFEKWEQEQTRLKTRVDELQQKLDEYEMKELLAAAEEPVLVHVFADKPAKELQPFAAKLTSGRDLLVLLASRAENKILLAHNGTRDFSCGGFFKQHLGSFGGKGGGNNQSAQAGFASTEDMLRFIDFARKELT